MDIKKIEFLLNRFFEGETSELEEATLKNYFLSDKVDETLKNYQGFFMGIYQNESDYKVDFESDVMNFILDNEQKEKAKFRWLWQTVTGVAATIILVLGGFLFSERQNDSLKDTFNDPEKAYAYAEQTMRFVSGKYNRGVEEMAYFGKLQKAGNTLEIAANPINSVIEKYSFKIDLNRQ